MMSKMRMTAVFLAASFYMTLFPVTAFAAGTETTEAAETKAAAVPETDVSAVEDETVSVEGGIDEETLKELLRNSSENTRTEDSIKAGEGESSEEIPDDSVRDETAETQVGIVTTNGGDLNVRTGAGTENTAFAQLPNGHQGGGNRQRWRLGRDSSAGAGRLCALQLPDNPGRRRNWQ